MLSKGVCIDHRRKIAANIEATQAIILRADKNGICSALAGAAPEQKLPSTAVPRNLKTTTIQTLVCISFGADTHIS